MSPLTERRWRRCVRGGVLIAALVAASPWFAHGRCAGILPSMSPFLMLLGAAARMTVGLFAWSAVGILLINLFQPRFFCRWVCPAGTCQTVTAEMFPRRQAPRWVKRMPKLGVGFVFVGCGAALAGYPLFTVTDPLVLFTAFAGGMYGPGSMGAWLMVLGFPVLVCVSMFAPGLWCGKLCPIGIVLDLLQPRRLAGLSRKVEDVRRPVVNRRAFLGLGLGIGYRVSLPIRAADPERRALRPPASRPESQFLRVCTRCGACVRSCPSRILKHGGAQAGFSRFLAPEVEFKGRSCLKECALCGTACPTGAIAPFTVAEKANHPIGRARIDHATCRMSCGSNCGMCIPACPYQALRLAMSEGEDNFRIEVRPSRCTGCGACMSICPNDSIVILPRNMREQTKL